MGLTKFQRNEIFRAIQEAGLSPEDFALEPADDESWLRHPASGAYFFFGGTAGSYTVSYVVGDGPTESREGLSHFGRMRQVGSWLSAVKLDVETPDLWAQLQRDAELLKAVSDEEIENTPFTSAEQEEIARKLRNLTDHVQGRYPLSAEQLQLLETRLNYLAAAAGRVGRKDWLLLAAGVTLGYVLPVAIPPEAAEDIVRTLLTTIAHILGGGPPGLPSG